MSGDPKLEASQDLPDFPYAALRASCSACSGIRVDRPGGRRPGVGRGAGRRPPGAARGRHRPGGAAAAAAHHASSRPRASPRRSCTGDPGTPADHRASRCKGKLRGVPHPMSRSSGARGRSRNLRRGRAQRSLARGDGASARCRSALEIYFDHYGGSFGNKWMWTPVVALAAAERRGRRRASARSAPRRPCCRRLGAATALDGADRRRTSHLRGRRASPGRLPRAAYNLVMGPPLLAPGSLALVGAHGRWPRVGAARALMAARFRERAAICPSGAATGTPRRPTELPRQRRGTTPQMHGRYPDYDVLAEARPLGRGRRARSCSSRVARRPAAALLRRPRGGARSAPSATSCSAQDAEPRIPVLAMVDAKLHAGELDGFRYDDMPEDPRDLAARRRGARRRGARRRRAELRARRRRARSARSSTRFSEGELGALGRAAPSTQAWTVVMRGVARRFYSHPWAWNEIGFGGPAYPRGYMRLHSGAGQREPWEAPPEPSTWTRWRTCRGGGSSEAAAAWLRRAPLRPPDNDSAVPARPAPPRRPRPRRGCAATRDDDEVDLLIVGAGAGGSTLAQRLARARLARASCSRRGRSGTPTATGSPTRPAQHKLYWTEPRVIGGEDPVELGKNNSGPRRRRLDGPLRRLHAALPSLGLRGRARATASAPTGRSPTRTCGPTTSGVERELPVAGQDWPWGDPHGYPHAAAPGVGGGRSAPGRARARPASRCASAPSASPTARSATARTASTAASACRAARSAPRPRPLVTHLPDAIEHGVEVRADSAWSTRIELDERGRAAPACTYVHDGARALPARPPRSPSPATRSRRRGCCCTRPAARFPDGLGNGARPGRPLRHGPGRAAGRRALPRALRMYKAPPPEISSEQFYETDRRAASRAGSRSRPSARCRSTGPSTCWPTGTGARRCASTCATTTTGHARLPLRAAARSRSNRVTLAEEKDAHGMPVARLDYSAVRQRPREHRLRQAHAGPRSGGRRGAGRADASTATRTSSAAARWARRRRTRVVDRRPPCVGRSEPVHHRRQRDAHAGRRQPGADDHGARKQAR